MLARRQAANSRSSTCSTMSILLTSNHWRLQCACNYHAGYVAQCNRQVRERILPNQAHMAPSWGHDGRATHFSIRKNLRNSQDLARNISFGPRSPLEPVLAKEMWRKLSDSHVLQPCRRSTLLACEKSNTRSKPITLWGGFRVFQSAIIPSLRRVLCIRDLYNRLFEVSNVPVQRVVQHEQASVGSVAHRP